MKAFFKDTDKIIINSMSYNEALVGKQFLSNLDASKYLKVEQRNDINDDFDGLVLSITNKEDKVVNVNYIDLSVDVKNSSSEFSITFNVTNQKDSELFLLIDCNVDLLNDFFKFLQEHGCTSNKLNIKENNITGVTETGVIGSYVIPKGMLRFHKFQSEEVYENNDIEIEFNVEQA